LTTTSVDFRPNLLPVRDQGRRSSCLAFATSTAHEHRAAPADHLCVEYLFFHSVERTPGKNPSTGTTMAAAAAALAEEGQPLEPNWPYQIIQPAIWSPPCISSTLHKTRMSLGKLSFDGIVAELDAGSPVILGIVISDAFYRPDAEGFVSVLRHDIDRGGHAVLAIGHGQAAPSEPALLIRNSWGSSWGVGGYAWLTRGYVDRQLHETAVLVKE
jgi:C1A family cysteine protease